MKYFQRPVKLLWGFVKSKCCFVRNEPNETRVHSWWCTYIRYGVHLPNIVNYSSDIDIDQFRLQFLAYII